MANLNQSSVYGPVKSWRLGASLGIDLLCVDSICSFACVYCQLGKINRLTKTRRIFVSTEKVLEDLKNSDWQAADVITFSGSGEPTLAKNLGEVIEKIKDFTGKPITVLTNSTLLNSKKVCAELARADKIFCKLDAWSEEVLRRVNRPHSDVSLAAVFSGIKLLRRDFKGYLAIQTMILSAPAPAEIKNFAEILMEINPDEVQLNLPTRPIPTEFVRESRGNEINFDGSFRKLKIISFEELEKIRESLRGLTNLKIQTTNALK
jgi:wyosine [tRNA(Phe)-imidazoG37] synthetase (radical SAM superfamily)